MANNLTLAGAAFDTAGQKFGAGALSGGYGVAPGGMISGFPLTWECRFKRASAPSSLEVIMGQSGLGWFGMTSAGQVQFEVGVQSPVDIVSSGSYADGAWHHAALSATASGFVAVIDGAVVGTSTAAPQGVSFQPNGQSPPSQLGFLGVGNHGGALGFQFNGEIDEAAVWSTNRYTGAYTVPTTAYTGSEANLLALYHLDSNGLDSTAGPTFQPIEAYTQQTATAVGAVGGGWTDVGPSWSGYDAGGGNFDLSNTYIPGAPWNNGQLVRKAAGEAAVNARVQVRLQTAEAADLWAMMRYSALNGDGAATAILAKPGQVYVLQNGALSTSYGQANALAVGTWFDMQADVVQQGAVSVVTVAVYSVANPTVSALCSGPQLQSNVAYVTDPEVQNLSGGQGMFFYDSTQSGGGKVIRTFATFSGDQTAAATTYTLTGPPGGAVGAPSAAFTVQCTGSTTAAVTVTPSDGGGAGAGTFSPASVTFAAGSTNAGASFTYTPGSAGAKTVGVSNSGDLADPSSLTYTAVSLTTLGVTSAAALFSPGNWRGDTGRGGTAWRQSWCNGAWASWTWTASASPTAKLLLNSPNSSNRLSYFLNGVLTANLAASGNITIGGLIPSATNTLRVYLRSSPQSQRWASGANTVKVLGLQIDGASTPGQAATGRPWGLIVGDSITEGIEANGGTDDHLMDYSFLVGRALDQLGYDVGVTACGYSGWIHTGDGNPGDVPAYYSVSGSTGGTGGTYSDPASRWNKVDSGISLLDSNGIMSAYGGAGTPPAFVYVNYMTNEALTGLNVSDAQASVTQALAALRAAAPSAWLFVQVPFALYDASIFGNPAYLAALKAGVAAYRAANPTDAKIKLLDFGATFAQTISNAPYINGDGVHPLAPGHALAAPMVAQSIVSSLLGQARSATYR